MRKLACHGRSMLSCGTLSVICKPGNSNQLTCSQLTHVRIAAQTVPLRNPSTQVTCGRRKVRLLRRSPSRRASYQECIAPDHAPQAALQVRCIGDSVMQPRSMRPSSASLSGMGTRQSPSRHETVAKQVARSAAQGWAGAHTGAGRRHRRTVEDRDPPRAGYTHARHGAVQGREARALPPSLAPRDPHGTPTQLPWLAAEAHRCIGR